MNLDTLLPPLTPFSINQRPAPGASFYNPGCESPVAQSHVRAAVDSAVGVVFRPGGVDESDGQRQWLDFDAGMRGVTVNEERNGVVKESNGQVQFKALSHLDQGKQVVTIPGMTNNIMADSQNHSVLMLPAVGRLW